MATVAHKYLQWTFVNEEGSYHGCGSFRQCAGCPRQAVVGPGIVPTTCPVSQHALTTTHTPLLNGPCSSLRPHKPRRTAHYGCPLKIGPIPKTSGRTQPPLLCCCLSCVKRTGNWESASSGFSSFRTTDFPTTTAIVLRILPRAVNYPFPLWMKEPFTMYRHSLRHSNDRRCKRPCVPSIRAVHTAESEPDSRSNRRNRSGSISLI
jgi:hypothetical protein